jgi:predicted amidophosphoribosyltransferase
MNLFGGRIECTVCGKSFPKKEGKVFVGNSKGGICRNCFEQWTKEGSSCAACSQPVHGTQDVGFFLQKKSMGHYDCGGIRMQ